LRFLYSSAVPSIKTRSPFLISDGASSMIVKFSPQFSSFIPVVFAPCLISETFPMNLREWVCEMKRSVRIRRTDASSSIFSVFILVLDFSANWTRDFPNSLLANRLLRFPRPKLLCAQSHPIWRLRRYTFLKSLVVVSFNMKLNRIFVFECVI